MAPRFGPLARPLRLRVSVSCEWSTSPLPPMSQGPRLNGIRQRVRKCRLQGDVVGADPLRHRKRQRRFATKRMRRVVADEVKFQRPESAACQHGPRRR